MENSRPTDFIVRETLLSRRPDPLASLAVAFSAILIILLSILAWSDIVGAQAWMPASRRAIFQSHEYWRAWTTLFVHGDGKHLLSNLFLYFILGSFLAGYFGIFLALGAAFFFGGLVNFIVLPSMAPETRLIGLSGVVFWMGGAWLILYVLLDRKRRWMQRGLRALGVALVLFMPADTFDPSVSYKSHFVGFFLGILAGLLYFLIYRKALREAEVLEAVIEEEDDDNVPKDGNTAFS